MSVTQSGDLLTLDFPAACSTSSLFVEGLGNQPVACLQYDDYVAVFESEEDVLNISPNHEALKQLDLRGVIVTAPSKEFDFVARFFAPKLAIPEDPVTGSAYTQLIPYWSDRLGKSQLKAKQVSRRGGKLECELAGDRVLISGRAVTYMRGRIEVDL